MNETLHIIDGRNVLRIEHRLPHAPAKVWRALTEAPHLLAWFPAAMAIDLRVGGEIRFTMDGGDDITTGVVTHLEPPRVFAYTWSGDHLRWEVHPEPSGCLLVLVHTFDDRAGAASFASGWHVCLDALAASLDERPFVAPDDTWADHETFIARFGLAQGHVVATDHGWAVRFERQFRRPVARVWEALLAGSAAPVAVGGPPPPATTVGLAPAGAVTEFAPSSVLEYRWQHDGHPAGRVRWQISQGPGGARLQLEHTGPQALADLRPAALAAWQDHIERLAVATR
ncbi:SRPBCC family protein [Nannocystis sp. SCPEA4]|uniref:SRPBCC family protein n=1 Tax=Nannocystis sp. SCPEA4 TaxID=2996787 RepID=UPI0022722B25|nr:SRPBCC family protein [Nannocystis sp. SCPEA4]MCY1058980.1 SRPBCC family protein [Nannocystis sp. SCPEA4]